MSRFFYAGKLIIVSYGNMIVYHSDGNELWDLMVLPKWMHGNAYL